MAAAVDFLWGDEGAVEKILLSRYAASILFLGKGGSMLVGKGGNLEILIRQPN